MYRYLRSREDVITAMRIKVIYLRGALQLVGRSACELTTSRPTIRAALGHSACRLRLNCYERIRKFFSPRNLSI